MKISRHCGRFANTLHVLTVHTSCSYCVLCYMYIAHVHRKSDYRFFLMYMYIKIDYTVTMAVNMKTREDR